MLVLVSSSANEQLQAHPGSTVCPRLDWTELEWFCQLCYVNDLCVEKHENSDPKLCGSLEDCFGP